MDITKVAQLARLYLQPDEKEKLNKDLENILNYVAQLSELATEKVQPTSHILNLENVYRVDEIKSWPVRDAVLRYAPDVKGNFFKVPKVIEGE
ncbi:MAG: Asp-tRNA(Asn)/Glu-tRNA(Gln) amidotransferase subunit GatC [Candidatus Omnitrophica bacterium]|nr:Asp-tRNA(Asn)/Glu-tRNA(Gln) amidotransferase subunit GatC [Candidatus Omnitrophota bacterium]